MAVPNSGVRRSLQVRDLETWSRGLCSELGAQETVRSATGAQTLKSEHDQVMAEIEAREETFGDVLKFGKMMMDERHYAAAEARTPSRDFTVVWALESQNCGEEKR